MQATRVPLWPVGVYAWRESHRCPPVRGCDMWASRSTKRSDPRAWCRCVRLCREAPFALRTIRLANRSGAGSGELSLASPVRCVRSNSRVERRSRIYRMSLCEVTSTCTPSSKTTQHSIITYDNSIRNVSDLINLDLVSIGRMIHPTSRSPPSCFGPHASDCPRSVGEGPRSAFAARATSAWAPPFLVPPTLR